MGLPAMREEFSPGASQIYAWAKSFFGERTKPELNSANRCSAAPQCVRKRWLQNRGTEGEPLQPRAMLVFAMGDIVEHVLKYFIKEACVGVGRLYSEVDFGDKTGTFTIQHREFDIYKQDELRFKIGGVEVTGHPDGWGKRNEDGKWELIECKSAADYGFTEFTKGECNYLEQVHAMMMSPKAIERDVRSVRFFYMNKNNSAIFDRRYDEDAMISTRVIDEYYFSNHEKDPGIPKKENVGWQDETIRNKSTGRSKLGWVCSYCNYTTKCYPNAKMEFSNTNKPVWVRS